MKLAEYLIYITSVKLLQNSAKRMLYIHKKERVMLFLIHFWNSW